MGSTIDWSQRPTYSAEQLDKYFDRIKLPTKYRQYQIAQTGANSDNSLALSFLGTLQRYQVAAVPFENLNLHYSVQRHISIEPEKLFEKIVDNKSERGGYCMENNTLFGMILRSLGYQVTSIGGRVNEAAQPVSASKNWAGPKYDGWNHMVNFVTIGEQKYLVDVGFGSNGPHQPIPLTHGFEFHNNKAQSVWQYDFRNGAGDWIPAYCFTETEFLPEDFAMINYYMSTSRGSWFTWHVVCVRMLLDDKGDEIVGDLTLWNDSVKQRIGAKSEVVQTFNSDEDRVAALSRIFKIHIGPADRDSIRRTISEIL